jgi:hypothetical protein
MSGQADRRGPGRLRTLLWAAAGSLLLVPAAAMEFTDEVRWDTADFLFAAGLIAAAGLALELLARRGGDRVHKASATAAVLAIFALVWINAAVGIIGGEGDPDGWAVVGIITLMIGAALFALYRRAH